MDRSHNETAIQVRAFPVLKGIRAAADLPTQTVFPDLMTEEELIAYLRIPQVSNSKDYLYVIDNLMRMRDLPCIHISRKRLFPLEAIKRWVMAQLTKEVA